MRAVRAAAPASAQALGEQVWSPHAWRAAMAWVQVEAELAAMESRLLALQSAEAAADALDPLTAARRRCLELVCGTLGHRVLNWVQCRAEKTELLSAASAGAGVCARSLVAAHHCCCSLRHCGPTSGAYGIAGVRELVNRRALLATCVAQRP
jgi:hypothetical protein